MVIHCLVFWSKFHSPQIWSIFNFEQEVFFQGHKTLLYFLYVSLCCSSFWGLQVLCKKHFVRFVILGSRSADHRWSLTPECRRTPQKMFDVYNFSLVGEASDPDCEGPPLWIWGIYERRKNSFSANENIFGVKKDTALSQIYNWV